MEYIQYVDMEILKFIHGTSNAFLNNAMRHITLLGNGGMIWIIIAILLLLSKKYRRVGILAALSLLLVTIFGEGIIKHIVQRPRPFTELRYMKILITKPSSYSFPSGHASSSFAVAYVIGKKIKPLRLPVYILAILIAYSRLYLFVHYPTDVLCGIILGTLTGILILFFDKKMFPASNFHR